MRLKRSWLSDRLRGGRRWFMPACVITYMDGRKLECGCGVKLEPDNLEAGRGNRLDNLLDKWNAHRNGRMQSGR